MKKLEDLYIYIQINFPQITCKFTAKADLDCDAYLTISVKEFVPAFSPSNPDEKFHSTVCTCHKTSAQGLLRLMLMKAE